MRGSDRKIEILRFRFLFASFRQASSFSSTKSKHKTARWRLERTGLAVCHPAPQRHRNRHRHRSTTAQWEAAMALLVVLSGSRYHHHARCQQTPMHKGKGRGRRFSSPHRHRHRHQRSHRHSHRHSHNLISSSCNTCQRCGNEDRKMATRWLPVSHRIITTSATRTAMPIH